MLHSTPTGARILVAAILFCAGVVACGGDSSNRDWIASEPVGIEAVPLTIAPRIAASQDGTAWLAWSEGDTELESLAAAQVDRAGSVARSVLSPAIQGAQRDAQIVMSGLAPVVAWRAYSPTGVRVHASAHRSGSWVDELDAGASYGGGIQLIALPDGFVSLVWQRAAADGSAELVSSQRSSVRGWSSPQVVARTPAATVMGPPRHSAMPDHTLAIIWSEESAEVGSQLQPQILMSSRLDATTGRWDAPTSVDNTNGRYHSYDIASAGQGQWVAVWASGDPSRRPALLSKRGAGTSWDATPKRIDLGEDYDIRELALTPSGSTVFLAWTGMGQFIAGSSVRVAALQSNSVDWSRPSQIGTFDRGYPQVLRIASASPAAAAVTWSMSQGDSDGPFLAWASSAGQWPSTQTMDPQGTGLAADLAFSSSQDAVAAWYRSAPQGKATILVRRLSSGN